MNAAETTPPTTARRGFTVLELLVVVGVIGLLAALILPAVQASREAARATHCRNNLKQFGLALHDFQSSRGTFPPAAGPSGEAVGGIGGHPAHVNLLAMLDAAPLAAERDRLRRLGAGAFGRAAYYDWRAATVAPFRCPSDAAAGPEGAGGTNYRLCAGSSILPMPFPWGPTAVDWDRTRGAFSLDRPEGVPPSAVRDGLSTTAAVSEKLRGDGAGPFDPRVDAWDTRRGLIGGAVTEAAFLDLCRGAPPDPAFFDAAAGGWWTEPGTGRTAYNHAAGPNPADPDCSWGLQPNGVGPVGPYAARSEHPGGVNLLLLDGAVRFAADAVDLPTWRALATRAGGETVGAF